LRTLLRIDAPRQLRQYPSCFTDRDIFRVPK
jgi:hypothetical protein